MPAPPVVVSSRTAKQRTRKHKAVFSPDNALDGGPEYLYYCAGDRCCYDDVIAVHLFGGVRSFDNGHCISIVDMKSFRLCCFAIPNELPDAKTSRVQIYWTCGAICDAIALCVSPPSPTRRRRSDADKGYRGREMLQPVNLK